MPCIGGPSHDDQEREERIRKQNEQKCAKYEAAFCAVMSELKSMWPKHEFDSFVHNASTSSGMDIEKLWEEHERSDIQRIKAELDKFSRHELNIIKKILKKDLEV